MPDIKKSKEVKNLKDWDDDYSRLINPSSQQGQPKQPALQSKTSLPPLTKSIESAEKKNSSIFDDREKIPSAQELESEWAQRIKDAKKGDKPILASAEKTAKRAETIEEVFETLKQKSGEESLKPKKGESKLDKIGVSETRLEKIGGTIVGTAPEVRERELTGQKLEGIYRLYPMGNIPPLNILSKAFYSMMGKSLEKDLSTNKTPLYPEEYVSFAVGIAFLFSIMAFIAIYVTLSFNIIFALLAFVLSLIAISFMLIAAPSIQVGAGSKDVDKQLPFALRHMSALLNAGISIFDTIVSVSKTDYGRLSSELDKVVWDVKSGENLADALEEASYRVDSHSFTRVTVHIRRALQMGGDIASIINQIADDLSFEMRMKISDFVEKLNAFAIVYIIGGIVGPVVISVFTVVGSAQSMKSQGMGGGGIDQGLLMFLILFIFPMAMFLITYVVKAMEPKV